MKRNAPNKVLFITHHYLTGNGGGVFASRAYINAFCEICESVTLLYPAKNGEAAEGIDQRVECIPVSYDKPKLFKFLDLLFGRLHRYFGVADKYFASGEYDTVVFDTSIVTWKTIGIAHRYGAKVITIHHNYQYEYSRDNTKGIIKMLTLFWIKRYERNAVRKSDLNLTLTNDDRNLLKRHYDPTGASLIEVLGVFEPERRVLPNIKTKTRGGNYIITGSLSAMQTYESLKEWIKGYFPILKSQNCFKSLTIAGKDPSEKLVDLCRRNGITVVANPASMDEVLENADVYICPVSLGGGLKLRIMDGLRFGLPVICHKVSARGYEPFIDKCMFTYDDEKSFSLFIESHKIEITAYDIQNMYFKFFSFQSGLERLKQYLT